MSADGWQRLRIGDLVAARKLLVSDGYRMKNEELGATGVPFVRGGDIGDGWVNTKTTDHIRPEFLDRIRVKLTQPGDTAFITKGTVGRAGYLRADQEPVVFAPQVAYWRSLDHRAIVPRFIFYLIRSPAFTAALDADKSHGAMVADYVSISQQHDFVFWFPPPWEQDAIAFILGALDDKIDVNRRMNETLEALARAIFKDWFVDFGPTRAKMEGQAPYLAPQIWNLFPDRMDEKGKPEGWLVQSVIEQADWINGAAYKNMHFVDALEGLPVVKIAELKNGVTSQTQFTNTNLGDRYKIDNGEMLFSWSGNPDTSIDTFIWTGGPAWLNQHIFAVRENGCRRRAFLYSLLKWLNPTFSELARNKQTTGLGHVTKDDLKRLRIVVPSPTIDSEFNRNVEPILSRVRDALFENKTLAATRDLLLPKLMSGEIRVRDAEKVAEAVV